MYAAIPHVDKQSFPCRNVLRVCSSEILLQKECLLLLQIFMARLCQ